MPQARLPDVNTAFIKWRNKVVTALEAGKYAAAIGSLNNFNACLPKEYQVKVSNDLYAQKLAAEHLLVHCKQCGEDVDYRFVKKLNVLCDSLEQTITRQKFKNVWVCSACQKDNLTNITEFTKAVLPNPYYIGVVQDPPVRKDGILDRHTYHKKIEKWCWTMLGELEFAAAKFRDDSWKKAIDAGYDIIAGGEEDDQS